MKTKSTYLFFLFTLGLLANISAQELIAEYPFDQNSLSGDYLMDISGNENNALCSGNLIFDPDRNDAFGAAVNLGEGYFLTVNENANAPGFASVNKFSAGVWVIRVSHSGVEGQNIFFNLEDESGNRIDLKFNEYSQVQVQHSGDGINYFTLEGISSIPLLEWHHIGFTIDPENYEAKLYIDGILEDEVNVYAAALANPVLYLGRSHSIVETHSSLCLDDLKLYNGILGTEAFQEMYLGSPTKTEELIPKADLVIFPNPSQSEVLFWSSSLEIETVQLFEVTGKQLHTQPVRGSSLNISTLQEGSYIIKFTTHDGKVAFRKLIRM